MPLHNPSHAAAERVKARLWHGNATVNGRSATGYTLYEDLTALLADYTELAKLTAQLAGVVSRHAWPMADTPVGPTEVVA